MDRSEETSGLQNAVHAMQRAKALARIAQAALSTGVEGAAVTAAKEAAPWLWKLGICLIVLVVTLPMMIFTALPHVFFGYNHASSTAVSEMTMQAANIGGVCMSLEEFQKTVIDSIVTSIVISYEQRGIHIDRVELRNYFEEDDLLWFTALNSVFYRQNLNEISIDTIRTLCAGRLSYSWSLFIGERFTKLTITIHKIDPDDWMNRLSFNQDQRTWCRALNETLVEGDAIARYKSYFAGNTPNYSGDPSLPDGPDAPANPGGATHGDGSWNGIDISDFVNPSVKNNRDLASYAIHAWENNWGYVWGTFGNVLTPSLFEYKLRQYPDGVGNYTDFIRDHWLNRRTADCIGLIKGYGWLNPDTLTFDYGSHGMPDYGANQMCQTVKNRGVEGRDYGTMSNLPEIPGLGLWKNGHAGIYIGRGYAIARTGSRNQKKEAHSLLMCYNAHKESEANPEGSSRAKGVWLHVCNYGPVRAICQGFILVF